MARDHARIQLAVWGEDDWRDLDASAQHAYWMLLSQPRLSYCGVLDYIPSRLAVLAKNMTESKVKSAIRDLERAKYVLVDRNTHELLVRTYVRHDGVLNRPNMGKATARALERVVSLPLRDAVITELGRLLSAEPGLSGWIGFREVSPIAFDMASAIASRIASKEA